MASKSYRLFRCNSGDTIILHAPFLPEEIHCPVMPSPIRPSQPLSPVTSVPLKNQASTFTTGYPVDTPAGISDGDSRLEKCGYCKKSIARDKDVFMCSKRVFCSEECHVNRIEMNKDLANLAANPRVKLTRKHV